MSVENTFVLFLLGAFALILVITFSRQLTNTWHGARRYGLFEFLLVVVGFLQWRVLERTDEALHLAASAQSASAQTAEATERAWIPPMTEIAGPLAREGKWA